MKIQKDLQEKLKAQEEKSAGLAPQISKFVLTTSKLTALNKDIEAQNAELRRSLESSQEEMSALKVCPLGSRTVSLSRSFSIRFNLQKANAESMFYRKDHQYWNQIFGALRAWYSILR